MKESQQPKINNTPNKHFNIILNSLTVLLVCAILLVVLKGDFNLFGIGNSTTTPSSERVELKEVKKEMTYSEFGEKLSTELMEKIRQKDFPRIYDSSSELLKTQIDRDSFINTMGSYIEWIGTIENYKLTKSYLYNDLLVEKVFKNTTGKALYAYEYEITNTNNDKYSLTFYYQQIEQDMQFCFAYMPADETAIFNKEIGKDNIQKINSVITSAISHYNEGKMKDLYNLMSKEIQDTFTEKSLPGLFDEQAKVLGKISKATYKTFDMTLYPPILLLEYECSTEKKPAAVITFAVINQNGEWKLLDFKEKK